MKDLAKLFGFDPDNWKHTNGVDRWGVYMPPNLQVIREDGMKDANGYVKMSDQSKMYVKGGPQYDTLSTIFHEAAHTVQPRLPVAFNTLDKTYRQTNGLPFWGYGNQTNPRSEEIFATMREQEAMMPKGKLIWDHEMGKDYIIEMQKRYPKMTREEIIKRAEHAMFPEHRLAR